MKLNLSGTSDRSLLPALQYRYLGEGFSLSHRSHLRISYLRLHTGLPSGNAEAFARRCLDLIAVCIFIVVFELLVFLLLHNAQLKIPGTFLCLSINIMFLMIGSTDYIERASVALCTIAIRIYFLIANAIIRLSTSEDFGNYITGEVRTEWPMRVLAAAINAMASIIYCADPLFILSSYCTKYCTESQQDKLNIAAWIGVIGMMGGTFAYSLIRDYLGCRKIASRKSEKKSPGRRPYCTGKTV